MERYARWRVLVDGDRVAVDPSGSVAALAAEDVAGGFPVAPEQLLARDEGPTVLDVRRPGGDTSGPVPWARLADVTGPADVREAVRAAVRVYHGETRPPDRRPEWFTAGWRDELVGVARPPPRRAAPVAVPATRSR